MPLVDVAIYLLIGAFTGFLAGLLGVGGGVVIVPILVYSFGQHGFSPNLVLPFALGTSLACIVITSLASTRAHHRKGTVEWWAVKRGGPWAALGTLAGALMAPSIPKLALGCFIGVSQLQVATMLIRQSFQKTLEKCSDDPEACDIEGAKQRGRKLLPPVSAAIGLISSWIGIGGGALLVPFLSYLKLPVKHAISTSAALGVPISIAGALGFLLGRAPQSAGPVPELSLGFIYLPAFLGIAAGSLFTVGLGARTSHRVNSRVLRRIFAGFLYLAAFKMLYGLLR